MIALEITLLTPNVQNIYTPINQTLVKRLFCNLSKGKVYGCIQTHMKILSNIWIQSVRVAHDFYRIIY